MANVRIGNTTIKCEYSDIWIDDNMVNEGFLKCEYQITDRLHSILEKLSIWRQENDDDETFEQEESDLHFILNRLENYNNFRNE